MSEASQAPTERFRVESILVVVLVYLFLVSIKLLGAGFEALGGDFTSLLQNTVRSPFVGLAMGVLVTSVVQSSSVTIATVIAMVGAGQLPVQMAVPMIMGANIGTTITNTLVSMAHVPHRPEFRRAVATATLHDFFNICCVVILFPLELATRWLERVATFLTGMLTGVETGTMPDPFGFFIKPVVHLISGVAERVVGALSPAGEASARTVGLVLILVALGILFGSLTLLVRSLRHLLSERMEGILDRYLLASTGRALALGFVITALFQSSSVTTSLMVPLGAAGLLSTQQVFPYMMGANLGTTIKATVAALATGRPEALTVALVHLLFNGAGVGLMLLIPPLRRVPVYLAQLMGRAVMRNRSIVFLYGLLVFFVLPGVVILLGGLLNR